MSISLTLFQRLLESKLVQCLIWNIGKWQLMLSLPAICFSASLLGSLLVIMLYIGFGGKSCGTDTNRFT